MERKEENIDEEEENNTSLLRRLLDRIDQDMEDDFDQHNSLGIELPHVEPVTEMIPNPRKTITIGRKEVGAILLSENEQRNNRSWIEVPYSDVLNLSKTIDYDFNPNELIVAGNRWANQPSRLRYESNLMSENDLIEHLYSNFPYMKDIFAMADNVVVAGGALVPIARHEAARTDVDIFFVDSSKEQVDRTVTEIWDNLSTKHRKAGGQCCWTRNQMVVTMYFSRYGVHEDIPNLVSKGIAYQFITSRCYESMLHVIGGFDIGVCMIATDGKKFVTNPFGAFSLTSRAILVDISRRSTSFGHRIDKYVRRYHCFVVMTNGSITEISEQFTNNVFVGVKRGGQKIDICEDFSLVATVKVRKHDRFAKLDKLSFYSRNMFWATNDYDSGDTSGRIAEANALMASTGKIDAIMWAGKGDINGEPKILHKMPRWYVRSVDQDDQYRHYHSDYIYAPLLAKWLNADEYEDYVADKHKTYHGAIVTDHSRIPSFERRVRLGIEEAQERAFKGTKWIVQDPGTQHTSTINPILTTARQFYHPGMCRALIIGIPDEVYLDFRCSWQKNYGCFSVGLFPRDILKLLMKYFRRAMGQDGINLCLGHPVETFTCFDRPSIFVNNK